MKNKVLKFSYDAFGRPLQWAEEVVELTRPWPVCNHHQSEGGRCTCVETYKAIVGGETIPKLEGYCACVRAADVRPDLLGSFASDLITHDRADLTGHEGPFLWVLRECGTALIRPGHGNLTVAGIARAFGGSPLAWFWWDGLKLHEVDQEKAERILRDVPRMEVLP